MLSKLNDTVAPMLKRLHGLAQDSPDLKDAVQCYETILPILSDANLLAEPVSITLEEARSKMESGRPLLVDLDLQFEGQAVTDLMLRLAHALESSCQRDLHLKRGQLAQAALDDRLNRATSAHKVRLAVEEGRLDVRALLPQIVTGENGPLTFVARGLELDPGLVRTLARYTIKPALRVWCQQLTPLGRGIQWHKAYCFICGAGATLGELQGNEKGKHLRCGLCGADWSFSRLRCAHCGNEDHRTLGYLYPETQREKIRIEVCHRCKGYLKLIAVFDPTPPEMLLVEDLATVHLDYIARERGYGGGPSSYAGRGNHAAHFDVLADPQKTGSEDTEMLS